MNASLIKLQSFEEAVGVLHDLSTEEGMLVANISKLRIVLPLEMAASLKPLIGKRRGILNTDDNRHLVRIISL
jgi:hypothetical protein